MLASSPRRSPQGRSSRLLTGRLARRDLARWALEVKFLGGFGHDPPWLLFAAWLSDRRSAHPLGGLEQSTGAGRDAQRQLARRITCGAGDPEGAAERRAARAS